jgi:DNA polymerase elongation subunit (family B)
MHTMDTAREKIKSVECLGEVDDYVYDISMRFEDPFFFANGILVHNTDSVYFTAVPALPAGQELDLDSAVKLYDHISDTVSASFPEFLKNTFNVPLENGKVMQAGREVVGRAGLFITKKRYAIMVLDEEGKRPEGGKLKIMGLDVKRSDTPEFVQNFLEEILRDCLTGMPESEVIDKIRKYKEYFKSLNPWKKGMPKRVNNLTMYTALVQKQATVPDNLRLVKLNNITESENSTVPGHVRASINWNNFKKAMGDNYSMTITDGAKVVVCKLKKNAMNYDSIAYPTDELQLPQWFKEMPFDEQGMEESVLDKKIQNVIGQMNFNLERINETEAMGTFFDFE